MVKGYVDSVVLALMPEVLGGLEKAVGGPLTKGFATDRYVEKMDEAGVEISVLLASKGGSCQVPGKGRVSAWQVPVDGIKKIIDMYPERFRALVGVDPTHKDKSLKEMRKAIRDYGFLGAHLYPHWWLKPPNHKGYYPFYRECVKLAVPIQIQVGSSLVTYLPSVGRPIFLEDVARDFPDLKIVGSHTGWPWVEEMIGVMQNHSNVYVTTSCHYPKTDWANPVTGLRPLPRWDDALIRFINEGWITDGHRGEDRVLLGTDFPEWEYKIMVDEASQVLTPSAFIKVCRDNAVKLYRLN